MKRVRDHYFDKARREGYAARSAYKLEEIDRKHKLLRPGQRVLDLGCAPGSWLQYAAKRVGAQGSVVGIDLQEVEITLPENVRVLRGDVFEIDSLGEEGSAFDLVLSDMGPKTSGVPSADAARSEDLARRALELAGRLLRPGGALLAKVYQGGGFPAVRQKFRESFERVTVEKPRASRAESVEVYLLGRGKRNPR